MMEKIQSDEVWALVRVKKSEIWFLRYTLEAYEGLCVPTTLPGGEGLVRLSSSAALKDELALLISRLGEEMEMELLRWGEGEE